MDLKQTYNKIARDWHNDHKGDTWFSFGTDEFLDFLPSDATVLDIGCGAGVKSRYMKDKGFNVEGFDFSENLLEIARTENPDITFTQFDLYNINDWPRQYDGVLVQAVLLHIPKKDVPDILDGIISKVKQGGYLYVGVKKIKDDGIEEKVIKESDYGYEYERFFTFFSEKEVIDLLESRGLEIVFTNEEELNSKWIQVIARKTN